MATDVDVVVCLLVLCSDVVPIVTTGSSLVGDSTEDCKGFLCTRPLRERLGEDGFSICLLFDLSLNTLHTVLRSTLPCAVFLGSRSDKTDKGVMMTMHK